jgi:hypothetical protein
VEQAIVGAPEFVNLRMSKLRLVGRVPDRQSRERSASRVHCAIRLHGFGALFSAQRMQGRKKVLCGILDQDLCLIMCPIAAFRKGFPPSV